MRILYSQGGAVDFDAPIQMTREQREQFVAFLRTIRPQLVVEERAEKSKRFGGKDTVKKDWSPAELARLLGDASNDELATELGRNPMGIRMMRGNFVPRFLAWLRTRNLPFPPRDEDVERFFRENGSAAAEPDMPEEMDDEEGVDSE